MKRFAILLLLTIVSGIYVHAYKRMLEGYPQWSYRLTMIHYAHDEGKEVVTTTFYRYYLADCECEVNGRNYHKLYRQYLYGEHEFRIYLREENGKIYTPADRFPYPEDERDYIEYPLIDGEYLLYDFSKRVQDIAEGIGSTLDDLISHKVYLPLPQGDAAIRNLNVFMRNDKVEYYAPLYTSDPEQEARSYHTYLTDPFFGDKVLTSLLSLQTPAPQQGASCIGIDGRKISAPEGLYIKEGKVTLHR